MASLQTQPAARLANDILLQIFYHLETDESLCVVALVCHSWKIPAQVLLYNTICFSAWDPTDSTSFERSNLFARTMHTAPPLARLVRYLSLHTDADVIRDQIEWLHLLPEHGLNRFRYMWSSENTFDPYILVAPAVRTVTHFIAHGPQNPSSLRTCLSLPNLEALEVSLADCDDDAGWRDWEIQIHASLAPRLRKLIIRVYFVSCPAALSLFAAFAPQLSAFQLHALYEIFEPHREWAAALTSPLGSHLKQLVLSGSICWTKDGRPFMDDVVRRRQSRSLELIRCPQGSYTDAFFRHLPSTVQTLELYVDVPHSRFAHERALVELLREVTQGRRQSSLKEVRFLSQYQTTLPLSSEVIEAFRESGVRLTCERAELYTPVQYMSEADIVESSFSSEFCH